MEFPFLVRKKWLKLYKCKNIGTLLDFSTSTKSQFTSHHNMQSSQCRGIGESCAAILELCPDRLKSSHLRILSCCSTEKQKDARIGHAGAGRRSRSPVVMVCTGQEAGDRNGPAIRPLSHSDRISFNISFQCGST